MIAALFELLEEGQGPPNTDALVERSGVSAASIFRYFDNLDDLQRQTIDEHFARFAPLFDVPAIGDGLLARRVKRFVDARLDLYEAIAPVARLARARAYEQPVLGASLRDTRRRLYDQVTAHFAPELHARTPAAAADLTDLTAAVTSFEAWDLLTEAGRTRRQVQRAWTTGLSALLASRSGDPEARR